MNTPFLEGPGGIPLVKQTPSGQVIQTNKVFQFNNGIIQGNGGATLQNAGMVGITNTQQAIPGANAGIDSAFTGILRLYNNFANGSTQIVTPNGNVQFYVGGNNVLNINADAMVINHPAPAAINSTATASAAQVATGYITSTSAAATTITLPTATAIAAVIGAAQGTVFDLYIDNTAGANTVTITPDASMTKSQVAQVATYGVPTFGLFTVANGTSGIGLFRMVFNSGTALVIARVF